MLPMPEHRCSTSCRDAFNRLTEFSHILLEHGDYHVHSGRKEQLQHDLHLSASGIRAGMDPHSGAPFSRACLDPANWKGNFSTCLVSHSCLIPKHAYMSSRLWTCHSDRCTACSHGLLCLCRPSP